MTTCTNCRYPTPGFHLGDCSGLIAATKVQSEPRLANPQRFPDRIRFNWGYHDAASSIQRGLPFFAKGGAYAGLETPEQVLAAHRDRAYAHGWAYGYRDAHYGRYCNDSEPAWDEYLQNNSFSY